MIHSGTLSARVLFFGDWTVFIVSLVIALFIRTGSFPSIENLVLHLGPFFAVFFLWTLSFFILGLYHKKTIFSKSALAKTLFQAHLINSALASSFFFLFPGIDIAPKTILILYLLVSAVFLFIWRVFVFPRVPIVRDKEHAILIAEGKEAEDFEAELGRNTKYLFSIKKVMSPAEVADTRTLLSEVCIKENAYTLIIDREHPALRSTIKDIYDMKLTNPRMRIISFSDAYEDVFDRVPLSLLEYAWFLRSSDQTEDALFMFLKRVIDILGAIIIGCATFFVAPIIWILMKMEGGGPLFISQTRFGKGGVPIVVYKFRTMTAHTSDHDVWIDEKKSINKVTRLGAVLRKMSLDEFPQFLNILKGEMSLIGPRNDIEGLGKRLAEAIPYYMTRYMVTPGLSGWAQINQQYETGNISPQSVHETKIRLAYDFFYIKHRSLGLDMVILLKTLKRVLFRF